MNDNSKKTRKPSKKKVFKPGNDVLNGIERWIPDGTERPSQFEYKSPDNIWYRNKREAGTCLGRAGVPEEKWIPVPPDPFAGSGDIAAEDDKSEEPTADDKPEEPTGVQA